MIRTLTALTLASLIATTSGAFAAGTYDPDARANEQAARIEAGRQSGSVTYFEGRALRKEQQQIADREAQLRAEHDGHLYKRDRRELKELQDKSGKDITQLSSNGWRRWWVLPRVGN